MLGSFFNRLKTAALTPSTDVDAFLRLVRRGDIAGVRERLEAGMPPDAANANGETALHIAARADRAEIIALLAKMGANLRPGTGDNAERTPLQDAINFGKNAAAVMLISCGGCPDNPQATQELLHRACEKDMGDVVSAFAAAGVDLRMPSTLKITPMMTALTGRKSAAVQSLLRMREVVADLNMPLPGDSEGRTLFHLAVARADSTLVEAMIADGALVNLTRDDGMTALHMAINRADAKMVAILLAYGADATRATFAPGAPPRQLQAAPLTHLAGVRNMNDTVRADIARLLIGAGADVNALDEGSGEAALHRLMSSGSATQTLAVFLKNGARIDMPSSTGATPLMLAIEGASLHEITNLLSAGADPNARHDRDARTPLMIAAALGQADTVRELLQAGANARLFDNSGHSAIYYAQTNLRMKEQTVPLLAEALRREVKPLFRGSKHRNGPVP